MALSDIIGHPTAIRILTGAMRRGRVASAYLFAGEEGIGKRLTALNFAKALNCETPVADDGGAVPVDACGHCPACRKIEVGTHPDFMIVEPDRGEIKIAQIRRDDSAKNEQGEAYRSVEEMIQFRALEARTRVVIVDDADTMNQSAANAFLKTLEEPPEDTTIILVSSRPDVLPQTIRSRCLRVTFRPLSIEDTAAVMRDAPEEAVILAMGRPGLGVREDLVDKRDRFLKTLALMRAEGEKPAWADLDEAGQWIEMCSLLLRDIAVMRATANEGLLINRDIPELIARMGSNDKISVKGIIEVYRRLRVLRVDLVYNLNRSISWNYAGTIIGELGLNTNA